MSSGGPSDSSGATCSLSGGPKLGLPSLCVGRDPRALQRSFSSDSLPPFDRSLSSAKCRRLVAPVRLDLIHCEQRPTKNTRARATTTLTWASTPVGTEIFLGTIGSKKLNGETAVLTVCDSLSTSISGGCCSFFMLSNPLEVVTGSTVLGAFLSNKKDRRKSTSSGPKCAGESVSRLETPPLILKSMRNRCFTF